MMPILRKEFYIRNDVVRIAKELLGKALCTHTGGQFTAGIIIETEAYAGVTDKASHAYGNRKTGRNEAMYREGGIAYVYLCYGLHHLFNVVTNGKNIPDAVLVRAVYPIKGIETMVKRRRKKNFYPGIATGPGAMSEALGITTKLNGTELSGKIIWIEERKIIVKEAEITSGPRVGVDYAGKDALKRYRFRLLSFPSVIHRPDNTH